MKKRPVHSYHSHNSKRTKNLLLLLIAVSVVILIAVLYVLNTSPNLQLSPADEGIGLDNGRSLLKAIGPECTKVALGLVKTTCKDTKGNVYSSADFQSLRDTIGSANIKKLQQENGASRFNPFARSTSTPTPTPTNKPTTSATQQPQPKGSANPSFSANPNPSSSVSPRPSGSP